MICFSALSLIASSAEAGGATAIDGTADRANATSAERLNEWRTRGFPMRSPFHIEDLIRLASASDDAGLPCNACGGIAILRWRKLIPRHTRDAIQEMHEISFLGRFAWARARCPTL